MFTSQLSTIVKIQRLSLTCVSTYMNSKSIKTRTSPIYSTLKNALTRADYETVWKIFDRLMKTNDWNTPSLLAILDACTKTKDFQRVATIKNYIDQKIEWKNEIRLQTSLINFYMKCQKVNEGKRR